MEEKDRGEADPRGPGSFCMPRAAIEALLEAKATCYEICACLTLARFTDASGLYRTASISAIDRATGANKTRAGPVARAIERLKTIRAKGIEEVSNGRKGKAHALIRKPVDFGPILVDRETWLREKEEELPDGPHERAKVLFVLPDLRKPLEDRVWFGNNLVSGVEGFLQPLKELKNAGDVAARLLLAMYAANDMEQWGGVRPVGKGRGPWRHYEPVADDSGLRDGGRLIRAKCQGTAASIDARITGGDDSAYWRALEALESAGFLYEMVVVLNRNAIPSELATSGDKYGRIPDDAEPLYELDCRSKHGYKPEGEQGIGGATARTAGDLGHSVATEGGRFDGTYAAIVREGFPAMVAGIWRLRFRVVNPKNAGTTGAWARIQQGNRDAFDLVQRIREANKLELLPALRGSPKARKERAAEPAEG